MKITMEAVGKYLALGGAAVASGAIVNMIPQAASLLANIPMWGQALFGGITVGAIVLGAAAVGLVDQLAFNK